MKIIAADDEKLALALLTSVIQEVKPEAELNAFQDPRELLEFAKENPCDVAFLDIDMGSMRGIEVAKQLKIWYPRINIVFVTGYDAYMEVAFKLRVSGYVRKPVTAIEIREELENLRNPVFPTEENKLVAKCFGTFDVFVNGKSLTFERTKTKELLAYLIDRRGSSVTASEIRAMLWQDTAPDKNTGVYLQLLKKDLIDTFRAVKLQDILKISRNQYAIACDKISCDYYDYLDGKPQGVRAYNGEYMAQYSWGEVQNVLLQDRENKR